MMSSPRGFLECLPCDSERLTGILGVDRHCDVHAHEVAAPAGHALHAWPADCRALLFSEAAITKIYSCRN